MRLKVVAAIAGMVLAACDEKAEETKTGKQACEAAGGSWSGFRTTQGLEAEICCRPAEVTVVSHLVRREGVEPSRSSRSTGF